MVVSNNSGCEVFISISSQNKLLGFFFEKLIIDKVIHCTQKNDLIWIEFLGDIKKMTFDCKGGLIQNYVLDFFLIITRFSLNFW